MHGSCPDCDLAVSEGSDAMEPDASCARDLVRLFTDGACSGNPGPGGWAYILHHPASGQTVEASGAEPDTTNNRMELMGVIEGLATLKKPCRVELVTDSQYVAKGISEWMPNWKRQGWMRKEGRPSQARDERRPLAEDRRAAGHPQGQGDPRAGPPRPSRERGMRPDGRRRLQGAGQIRDVIRQHGVDDRGQRSSTDAATLRPDPERRTRR